MYRLLALYGIPKDPAHFRDYYVNKHIPLASQMPGVKSAHYTFEPGALGPDGSPYFCIWEGEWESKAAFEADVASELGGRVAADTQNYATGGLTMLHFETTKA